MSQQKLKEPFVKSKAESRYARGGLPQDAIEEHAQKSKNDEVCVRGYLMLLLGSTIFVDVFSDRVTPNLFPMLRDVTKVKGYAWGAATLAFLYRQMWIASRAKCIEVAGCLALLQAWIYEYFPTFRPREVVVGVSDVETRALCWRPTRVMADVTELHRHRRVLDALTADQVTWIPYGSLLHYDQPITLYAGCLRFLDVVEPYPSDRCLLQLGYRQIIRTSMLVPDLVHYWPVYPNAYKVKYSNTVDSNWLAPECHWFRLDIKSQRAVPSYAVAHGYLEWYRLRTHPSSLILPPSLGRSSIMIEVASQILRQ